MKITSKDTDTKLTPIITLAAIWLIYTVCYIALKQNSTTNLYPGLVAFIGEVGLDCLAAILTLQLWTKSSLTLLKKVYLFFCISFFLAAITDCNYNLTANILGITHISNIVDSIFDIPFLGILIFQILAWAIIFLKSKPSLSKITILTVYLPITLIAIIIFTAFFYDLTWGIRAFSLIGLYIIIETVLQWVSFVFVSLYLATTNNKQFHLVAIGYLIITTSDLIVHLNVLAKTLKPDSILETTWVLGLLFIALGFYKMLKFESNRIVIG